MSASLVGSEMCIRDIYLARARREDQLQQNEVAAAERAAERAARGEEAVSYTHLTLPTICSV
eukprot:11440051-Alexandrium_andersonii.AAC.1